MGAGKHPQAWEEKIQPLVFLGKKGTVGVAAPPKSEFRYGRLWVFQGALFVRGARGSFASILKCILPPLALLEDSSLAKRKPRQRHLQTIVIYKPFIGLVILFEAQLGGNRYGSQH